MSFLINPSNETPGSGNSKRRERIFATEIPSLATGHGRHRSSKLSRKMTLRSKPSSSLSYATSSTTNSSHLLALSLELKWQLLQSCCLDRVVCQLATALDELAMLCHANTKLIEPCNTFLLRLEAMEILPYTLSIMWTKAKVGLCVKLAAIADKRPREAIEHLMDTAKETMADTLRGLHEQNKCLSRMLRQHPHVTERGFCQVDASAYDLFKHVQRLSIDAAVLASSSRCAPAMTKTTRRVSFDENGPRVIGNADGNVDRAPVPASRPRKLEMLIIRGSRVLQVV
ncbi:hypothetical protein LEN26_002903 [Aphanomyces euteiches]|nr:hypothetical protein AeMF1_008563 [Aphanomyces euteiches]KAH9158530.1 hypothetical protein LEN26_002903 [Aphanomyces euteiches]KAH9196675.1 hypothetical protein AeNC1_001356 [Aphanomyces euteiches]